MLPAPLGKVRSGKAGRERVEASALENRKKRVQRERGRWLHAQVRRWSVVI